MQYLLQGLLTEVTSIVCCNNPTQRSAEIFGGIKMTVACCCA